MKKNTKILLVGFAFMIGVLTLLIVATPGSASRELSINEINYEMLKGKFITTQGFLIEESVKWDADNIEIYFEIQEEETNGEVLKVIYNGVRPDNFSEGVIVIVSGFFQEGGLFVAEKVQTKCPSKYEGSEYDSLKHEVYKQNNS